MMEPTIEEIMAKPYVANEYEWLVVTAGGNFVTKPMTPWSMNNLVHSPSGTITARQDNGREGPWFTIPTRHIVAYVELTN